VNLQSGVTEWEAMLSPPTGRSDLERLSDVDGTISTVGQDVYATGYQGRLAALAAESGQILWAREISTYAGVTADWNNIYTTNADGEVLALVRKNGSEAWRQDALLRRDPTVPVPFDTAVAVGDFDGYVHFFSNLDGHPVARVRLGKGMISGSPVVIGGRLYVQSEGGALAAYSVPDRNDKAVSGADN
jgi:outer membrane protein assembly factor BamB